MALLRCGGFELRKWSSNSHQLLNEIPTEFREHQGQLELNWDESIKTLGIHWSPSADCFGFNINHISDTRATTKRIILSQSSKIFDPLGWVSPSTIIAKIILQELWVLGISWDEVVPQSIAQRWLTYRGGLGSLETLKIGRWINYSGNDGASRFTVSATHLRKHTQLCCMLAQFHQMGLYTFISWHQKQRSRH